MSEKIFWSDAEKRTLARHALEIQERRPDLAGVTLVSAAIKCLPTDRQRHVVSLAQVEWWDSTLAIEAKLRAAGRQAAAEEEDLLPTLERTRANTLAAAKATAHLDQFHGEWRAEQTTSNDLRNQLLLESGVTLSQIHSDHMQFCLLLKCILDELTMFRQQMRGKPRPNAGPTTEEYEQCERCSALKVIVDA